MDRRGFLKVFGVGVATTVIPSVVGAEVMEDIIASGVDVIEDTKLANEHLTFVALDESFDKYFEKYGVYPKKLYLGGDKYMEYINNCRFLGDMSLATNYGGAEVVRDISSTYFYYGS